MEKFVIEGGTQLAGTIVPSGNKNGALPILAACLLTEDEVTLRNVPKIRDVEAMMLLLEALGASVSWSDAGEVTVDASNVSDGRRGRFASSPSGSGPRSCSRGRCWRGSGTCGCRRPAAT